MEVKNNPVGWGAVGFGPPAGHSTGLARSEADAFWPRRVADDVVENRPCGDTAELFPLLGSAKLRTCAMTARSSSVKG